MKTLLLVTILIFLAAGCATTYTHPTKSPSEFEKDRLECEQVAIKSLAARGVEDC
jgi:PBP1b-binding outer membrane lipoprotein LpoB